MLEYIYNCLEKSAKNLGRSKVGLLVYNTPKITLLLKLELEGPVEHLRFNSLYKAT